jgi:hypothetical protein
MGKLLKGTVEPRMTGGETLATNPPVEDADSDRFDACPAVKPPGDE